MATPSANATQPASPAEQGAVLSRAVWRAADYLGVNGRDLGLILGLSAPSISRLRAGTFAITPGAKSWELAALFVRLFRGLDSMTGGDDATARAWLTTHNHHLGGVPRELIREVAGLVNVVGYVDAFRARI